MNTSESNDKINNKNDRHGLVGPVDSYQSIRDLQINFLLDQGLLRHHKVLDFGCGTLRGGIPIIDYLDNGLYYGVEVSSIRLDEGLKELNDEKLTHKNPLLTTDINRINEIFDIIWCYQVFIHLSDELLINFISKLPSLLKSNGKCFATINCHSDEGSWQEFPFVKRTISFYEGVANEFNLKISSVTASNPKMIIITHG
jgi:cyclopropane fatty-acyl-phospholipid synthase-like methyltransferase